MELDTLRWNLRGVCACRHIARAPVMGLALEILDALAAGETARAVESYAKLYYALEDQGCRGLGAWLHDALRYQDSPYARLVERGGSDGELERAARHDMETFAALAGLDWVAALAQSAGENAAARAAAERLPRWEVGCPFTLESVSEFYRKNGGGLFARYRAFLWEDGQLMPVEQPDCPGARDMLGYELQRDQVVANTRAMMEGNLVNNVLLYGDSGTGKSATVKSLLSLPGFEDLRLIEVQKEGLGDMPQLIRSLGDSRRKFILFIDDLAFDQDDRTYSVLKTILEGGLERRPANVAIYATSNRRRLVRQTFSDRAGDEVDAGETIQEKTSLSDRFGLRIPYLALNKAEFLELVENLADQAGVATDRETLRADALKWEMRHPGRTPRTAKQFIASLSL